MTRKQHAIPLLRVELRRYHDKATNSACLRYVGARIVFHDTIYGYPDGVFFVASLDEMPFPPSLLQVADETGIPVDSLDVARSLKLAAVDALVAEAMVKAPSMLAEFADPLTYWAPWDHRELERQHVIAISRLVELTSLAERELRLRSTKVPMDPGLAAAVPMMPVWSPWQTQVRALHPVLEAPLPMPTRGSGRPVGGEAVQETVQVPDRPKPIDAPTEAMLQRVNAAIRMAREVELAQRLPQGSRRSLEKKVRASYIVRDSGEPMVRGDLVEAMNDAERTAAEVSVETTVIDWDGEYPVVVRRYGPGGRTVYRVEEALRRAGYEEHAA